MEGIYQYKLIWPETKRHKFLSQYSNFTFKRLLTKNAFAYLKHCWHLSRACSEFISCTSFSQLNQQHWQTCFATNLRGRWSMLEPVFRTFNWIAMELWTFIPKLLQEWQKILVSTTWFVCIYLSEFKIRRSIRCLFANRTKWKSHRISSDDLFLL